MGRLFESPWPILIIIIVALLLFAAPKLPGMARSLGQSMRILKSEVKEMKNDGKQTPESSSAASEQPVEGKVIPPKGNDQGNGSAPRV
ncbi:Sec-independent protein translocase subunit TatA [Sinomonas sp. R1AF57]|uniref:Sec-independent protein translocase subunit TatA n=1 Tax=Sinomonas sp. R1AF57 TaxID=2020377 RepID=UPI000B5DD81B|nr:Sec-independent protein translocase subunit TatA [Sinomonas sp. R1AF57]ASN51977.1 Sec-independent protein translocase TatA [Sinomonas sp. R1AF57]